MIQKLAAVLLVGACLMIAACNTVRGAATDVGFGRQLHRECDARREVLSNTTC